jgi:Ca-activated chloride channel homolog
MRPESDRKIDRKNDRKRSSMTNGGLFRHILLPIAILITFTAAPLSPREPDSDAVPLSTPAPAATFVESSPSMGDFKLGVHVDVVMMYTSVSDRNGNFITGLTPENFRVYEDGVEQNITIFAQEDIPVSTGILLDVSASMRGKMEQVNQAALAFILASNPADEVFLISFNDEVTLLQDFTSDIDDIRDALDNAIVTGGTALFDAVYLGIQKAATGDRSKKAILVLSDGEDKDSYYQLNELMSRIQESDVQVFSIGILETAPQRSLFGRWTRSLSEQAADALRRISDATGGKAFFPEDLPDIHDVVSEISRDLRSQYSIGYVSSNTARDGSFRQVKIELTGPGTKSSSVRHRRGYFAPRNDDFE